MSIFPTIPLWLIATPVIAISFSLVADGFKNFGKAFFGCRCGSCYD